MCTAALVDRLSPTGVYVPVACVGDRIEETGEIESATASCVEESPSEGADDEEAGDAATTTDAPPATAPAGAVPDDIGPLAWDGDLTLPDGSSLVPVGEQWISITRTDGTNDFEGAMEVATMGDHRFVVEGQIDPVECTSVLTKRFSGTGAFADFPNQIVLAGELETDVEYDCPVEVAETLDGTQPFQVLIVLTDTGIEGVFEGFEFELPGVPVPIPG